MYNLLELDQIDSTQIYARTLLEKVSCNTLITAKIQTAGIGQRGNKWINFPGNFCGSFIFPNFSFSPDAPGHLAIVIAVAIGDFFMHHQFENFSFKWPNDIYDKKCLKKLGGILCEIHGNNLIVGIGINFLPCPPSFDTVTSLTELGATHLISNWENLVFFKHLHQALLTYSAKGFSIFQKSWETHCGHMNKFMRTSGGKEGIFNGLQTNGFPHFQ
jgi:biotin-[acetyl-CoA-carboxylase] ligase BirA-like protein